MSQVESVSATESLSTITTILERDGCIVIEDILTPFQLQLLNDQLEQNFKDIPNCQGEFFGYTTKRMSGVIKKSSVSRDMAVLPQILGVMDHFLLQSCREYQLNLTQAIQIGPGEEAQIIHTDELLFPFEHPGSQAMINCMWAVSDFTPENGATIIIPGSHKWERERQPQPHEITCGAMKKGSVLIYFGSLLHAGGANKTQTSRTGLVLSYCLGWLRQVENHYLAIPLEEARTYPERLQRLLGYFVHEPNMGCVEGQNPINILYEKEITNQQFQEFIPEEAKTALREHREKHAAPILNDTKAYASQ